MTVYSGLDMDGNQIDVVYSADDGGYYAHNLTDDTVTQLFTDRAALESALARGDVVWTD